ncbi:MAG: ion transporter [Bacteroidales bacterium]|nr:ion transporter [Bacteroidales bacterium]
MNTLKKKLYTIVFESDTFGGKLFDIMLLLVILFSIVVILLESVVEINTKHGELLKTLEWIITIVFSIEYIVRIMIVKKASGYIFSFYGIIDFLAIIPAFIGLIIPGGQSLIILRALRMLRLFRILHLDYHLKAGEMIILALANSRQKILVFFFFIVMVVIILGTIMYLIEGPANGFTSIPQGIYWTVVTLTTVGYGDITPQTVAGKFLSSIIMILGYAIIAVPTGIVTSEINSLRRYGNLEQCESCGAKGHDPKAEYCYNCGEKLHNV